MPFSTDVTAIWGSRGSGKTTLARKLLADNRIHRAVILDPISPEGCTSVGEVLTALDSGHARVVMRNPSPSIIRSTIYAAFLRSSAGSPLFCVCDEAPSYLDQTTEGLNKIMFQGRHRAFGMLLLGQRPTAVSAQIRSQAVVTYWMRLSDHRDQQIAAQSIGPDRARALASLKEGAFFKHPER